MSDKPKNQFKEVAEILESKYNARVNHTFLPEYSGELVTVDMYDGTSWKENSVLIDIPGNTKEEKEKLVAEKAAEVIFTTFNQHVNPPKTKIGKWIFNKVSKYL